MEKQAAKASKGCLMLAMPEMAAEKIRAWSKESIDSKHIVEDEDWPHLTLCYGFTPEVETKDFLELLPARGISVSLGKIKRFPADDKRPESDVLVLEASGTSMKGDKDELRLINSALKEKFEVNSTYRGYNPHVTLCYVKPGSLKDLDGQAPFDDESYPCVEAVYSSGPEDSRVRHSIFLDEGAAGKKHDHKFCKKCEKVQSCRCSSRGAPKPYTIIDECWDCGKSKEKAAFDSRSDARAWELRLMAALGQKPPGDRPTMRYATYEDIVKSASPRWAKMLAGGGIKNLERLAEGVPSATRQIGRAAIGAGSEGKVFPAFTGGLGESVIKKFHWNMGSPLAQQAAVRNAFPRLFHGVHSFSDDISKGPLRLVMERIRPLAEGGRDIYRGLFSRIRRAQRDSGIAPQTFPGPAGQRVSMPAKPEDHFFPVMQGGRQYDIGDLSRSNIGIGRDGVPKMFDPLIMTKSSSENGLHFCSSLQEMMIRMHERKKRASEGRCSACDKKMPKNEHGGYYEQCDACEKKDENDTASVDHSDDPLFAKTASIRAHLNLVCRDVNTEPTEGQKDAGNYRKGHWSHKGLNFSIENPKGSKRSGKDKDGTPWEITMSATYGYVKGTTGRDGDQLDVFFGPKLKSDKVFVIDQMVGGKFDEHKCIIFTNSESEAKELYLSNYPAGWKCGPITDMSWSEFKDWAMSDKIKKPAAAHARSRMRHFAVQPFAKAASSVVPKMVADYSSGKRTWKANPAYSDGINDKPMWEELGGVQGAVQKAPQMAHGLGNISGQIGAWAAPHSAVPLGIAHGVGYAGKGISHMVNNAGYYKDWLMTGKADPSKKREIDYNSFNENPYKVDWSKTKLPGWMPKFLQAPARQLMGTGQGIANTFTDAASAAATGITPLISSEFRDQVSRPAGGSETAAGGGYRYKSSAFRADDGFIKMRDATGNLVNPPDLGIGGAVRHGLSRMAGGVGDALDMSYYDMPRYARLAGMAIGNGVSSLADQVRTGDFSHWKSPFNFFKQWDDDRGADMSHLKDQSQLWDDPYSAPSMSEAFLLNASRPINTMLDWKKKITG